MATLQLIGARERDLGGFAVRRVLPHTERQMVGPFIFFDHLGPASFAPGRGIDVRPHPHIALATVTYLFEGSLEHRDSLGSVREILPGDVNWMTAGHGIVHSERTPQAARRNGAQAHGIQSWVALPDFYEDVDPSFVHYPARDLPKRNSQGVELCVIAGEAFGLQSPVASLWPTLYVAAQLQRGASLEIPLDFAEQAVYVAHGSLMIGDTRLAEGQLAVLPNDAAVTIQALEATRAMLLGGDQFPTPRHIWWNFVASSEERIETAKQRWAQGQFPTVPGEHEFIPLPNQRTEEH